MFSEEYVNTGVSQPCLEERMLFPLHRPSVEEGERVGDDEHVFLVCVLRNGAPSSLKTFFKVILSLFRTTRSVNRKQLLLCSKWPTRVTKNGLSCLGSVLMGRVSLQEDVGPDPTQSTFGTQSDEVRGVSVVVPEGGGK